MAEEWTRKLISPHPTHIDRLNGWDGSDSFVEGAEVVEMPVEKEQKQYPFMLLTKSTDSAGFLRRAGEVVMLYLHQVGPHHAKLPDVDYPPEAEPPEAETRVPPTISMADHAAVVSEVVQQAADATDRIASLEAQVQDLNAQLAATKGKPKEKD